MHHTCLIIPVSICFYAQGSIDRNIRKLKTYWRKIAVNYIIWSPDTRKVKLSPKSIVTKAEFLSSKWFFDFSLRTEVEFGFCSTASSLHSQREKMTDFVRFRKVFWLYKIVFSISCCVTYLLEYLLPSDKHRMYCKIFN